jgi:CubicO group peptidase (beta-lactamase class C family)
MRTRNQLPKSVPRRGTLLPCALSSASPAYRRTRRSHRKIVYLFAGLVFFVVFWVFSCGQDNTVNPPAYTYRIPEETGDGWQTTSLADVGIDENVISAAINRINYKLYQNVHGILIVKNGKLVFEEYFSGQDLDITDPELKYVSKTFDRNTLHYQASVTKSVTSALFGMAMDKKLINSVDDPLFSYLPEYADLKTAEKDKITLDHTLAMASGIPWDESSYPYSDNRNDMMAMMNSNDPIRFILSKNLVASPGTRFIYNSGTTNVLGDIVLRRSGMLLTEFARQHLFKPLGISKYSWMRFPRVNTMTFASGGLYLRPRDMAKFGLLYLQEGRWSGNQIISKEWVAQSTKAHIAIDSYWDYGYQWWLRTYYKSSRDHKSFAARGWGGQYIIVFPSLEMVVVFTGGNYSTPEPVDEILTRFILPAVR